MASNLLSGFNDDTPSLTPQNTSNLIDFDSPTSDGLKTSSEDLSSSNQLEDHFDLLTTGHKMSDSHQINTNYDDQFADLLGDISENGLHNNVLNKNNMAEADQLTVGDSSHEQREEMLISTEDNRLSCASFSLSPPPSELNPSMTEDLDDMMLADFPDTSAPKAEMEDDTDDDIPALGQGSPIHQTGVATELDHLISLHPQQGLIDDDKMYENDALVPHSAPIDKSDDDISEVIMEGDVSINDVLRDAHKEDVADGSQPLLYVDDSSITIKTSADQETYCSKYKMLEVDNSDVLSQTTHKTWQSEYTHDTKYMTSSDSDAQHSGPKQQSKGADLSIKATNGEIGPNMAKETERTDRRQEKPSVTSEENTVTCTALGTDYRQIKQQSKAEKVDKQAQPTPIPVNRQTVEKVAPPEITKSVRAMFESGQLPDLHPTKKTQIDEKAPESGVYENKPVELEGVVKSSDVNMEGEELQKGLTKNLLNEWKKKGDEDDKWKEPQQINVAEDEGRIIENEPVMRMDVIRECDIHPSDDIVIEKGYTKNLKEQLLSSKDKPKEKKVIKLVENEEAPTVFENTPVQLEGVVRAADETDDTCFERGKAKNLASYFLTRTDDVNVKKEPIRIDRDMAGPTVLENQPEVLEGVVRASDPPKDEVDIKLSKGHARNMVSMWQKQNEEEAPKAPKQPIKIEMATQGPTVVENEPVELEGVVKCDTVVEDIIPGNRGRTKDIAGMFLKGEETKNTPKKPIEIERADGPVVLENDPAPVPEGVVRSDSYQEDLTLKKGHTKNLLQQWSTKQQESSTQKTADGKPAWVKEIEAAKDSGVFENEPVENPDVVKESDIPECEKSQCIPDNYTASLKTMWMKKAEEEEQIKRKDRVPEKSWSRQQIAVVAGILCVVVSALIVRLLLDSGEGQRLEDRLADYQPPKRISKNEKDTHCGPSVYITGGAGSDNMCKRCKKRVYEMEKMIADKDIYHKLCFRCLHCNRILSFGNFAAIDGQPYCKPHFIELFKKRGQYDTITTESRADIISDANRSDGGVADDEYDYENREDEPTGQTCKEEPIHFEQMSSVRNMFESASKNAPDVMPATRWSKPKNTEPEPKIIQQDVPKVVPEVKEEPQKEEDELPPPAITRNLVARFQTIQQNDTSGHAADRKPIHKITPPRDVLAHGIEEAQRNSECWQEDGEEQSPSPEIIKSGTEPYPASELPPPKMMQSVLAKFKSMEDLSTRAPASPERTPVKHASSNHRQGYNGQTRATTSSSIKHSDSLPADANRYAEEVESVHPDVDTNHCDKVEEEKELPDEGFTKNLLAKWRSLEENALPTRHRDTSVASKHNKRSVPTRAHSLPAYTRTPEKYVIANRQPTAKCQEDIKDEEYLDEMDSKKDIVRESDNNEEDYLPPPSFIKNILAKFQSLEVEAEHQAKETTLPSKKNFKWSVKEAPLISPSGIVWQEKRRQSSTDSDGHPSNHSPAHDISYCTEDDMYELHEQSDDPDADIPVRADEPTNQDEELPPPSLTKNMLAKFRSLEGATESVTSP